MIALLAEASTPPPGTESWLAIFFYLCGGLGGAAVAIKQFLPGKKQQREIVGDSLTVREAVTYASTRELKHMETDIKSDLEKLFKRMDHISDHIAASEARVLNAGEARMEKLRAEITDLSTILHNRVTDAMQTVAHLRGTVEGGLGYPKSKH